MSSCPQCAASTRACPFLIASTSCCCSLFPSILQTLNNIAFWRRSAHFPPVPMEMPTNNNNSNNNNNNKYIAFAMFVATERPTERNRTQSSSPCPTPSTEVCSKLLRLASRHCSSPLLVEAWLASYYPKLYFFVFT